MKEKADGCRSQLTVVVHIYLCVLFGAIVLFEENGVIEENNGKEKL